ncbi:MAG: methyltransferase domain-containing protein [Actinobacteria bacterium]|nr:methyltransferase domain-containing protein [Actinomycetota bacterium]
MELHTRKAQALKEFEEWSGKYDRSILNLMIFKRSHGMILKKLLKKAGSNTSTFRILDIGCGTGTFLAGCLATGLDIEATGLDLSFSMIHKAKSKADSIKTGKTTISFLVGDAEQLPFENGYFDMVSCSNSFHHYPQQSQAVREMRRVLKSDGELIIIDGYRDDPLGYLIYEVLTVAIEKDIGYCSRRRFMKLLKEAGFKKVTYQTRGLFPPLLAIWGRLEENREARGEISKRKETPKNSSRR